jgi:dihydrofolate reductase
MIKLFIATTIDGFIARKNHSLDWLFELPNPGGIDHGYNAFIADIDLIIMGRKTYEEVLGFGVGWPYENCTTLVVTSDPDYAVKTPDTRLLSEISADIIRKLRSESVKNIWLVGGGMLITRFLDEGAIDEMTLNIIPILLGQGIRLFPGEPAETKFEFIQAETFETGVVNLTYRRRI